jgi:4-hydroxy-tetrahydrodipicolinate synthase
MDHKGTITALITPFVDLKLDLQGLEANIQRQISTDIDALLILGTTGESATLTKEERCEVIRVAVATANGSLPIWVGTGSYATQDTIERTKEAQKLGADVALVVTPYYNRPTQEGVFRHFEALSQEVEIPICVYNIPGRCGVNIEPETLLRIAALPNIMGVKEASGNVGQVSDIIHMVVGKYPHFKLFSGDDALTLPMIALGAAGVISVISNLLPQDIVNMVNAALASDYIRAREIHYRLLPLFKAAFLETNPSPIKTAMDLCGYPAGACRLPLVNLNPKNHAILKAELERLHLIEG